MPDDAPSDLAALARLQILNTLLLGCGAARAAAAGSRSSGTRPAVLDPAAARSELARLVPEAPGFVSAERCSGSGRTAENTFATTTRQDGTDRRPDRRERR